ncbi:MAG: hypothetical protein A2Y57_01870 [Candidatus Woykebacteria bacterium RBG_13_40_7b]|uniref:Uncharacterized protein n=1 Tax=Candidatus Woykebacteria bacterium RBG_13_40_7b TaxID=1802594 RepID=A0A1G1WAE3_9BACT|nr:MAG: hypothetical protein A2Y57_01870 [Candidatus Woykebacteria bacterium RBG_13_40_7b]
MAEQLSLNGTKAAIFDMDGTMVDDMAFHEKSYVVFCQRHNLKEVGSKEYKEKYSGKRNDEIFQGLLNKKLSQEQIEEFIEEKEQIYRDIYSPYVEEVEGLLDLVKFLREDNVNLALATTAPRKNKDFVLKKLRLEKVFDVVVVGEEVKKGKPDPEIYLITAEKLNIEPEKCLVFEDSPPGVESAKRAGMKVIGILTTHSKEELQKADLVINNFSELKLID